MNVSQIPDPECNKLYLRWFCKLPYDATLDYQEYSYQVWPNCRSAQKMLDVAPTVETGVRFFTIAEPLGEFPFSPLFLFFPTPLTSKVAAIC